ncbi:MAG: response regulator [Pseudomonadota bacterium]
MDRYCAQFGQLMDRRRAEMALLIAKQNAEQAAETAQAANRAKTEFLANVSHEIRTPMNGVLGMTDLLLQSEMSDRQRKFAQTAHQSAEALLRIINDILDFSRIDACKLELDLVDFNILDTVAEVVELLAESAQRKSLEIVYLIDRSVPHWVRGDPNRIRQILTNLIGNAIKFTERGEIVIRVNSQDGGDDTQFVSFEIKDTGIGIAPEMQLKILEPFQQADGSITRRFGGTGLGLSISLKLIEMMGGSLAIESAVGEGSTFLFTVQFDQAISQASESGDHGVDLAGLRVLVVDDNATNRDILHYYLDEWQMSWDAAESGEQALQALFAASDRGEPFDIALLDMMMPGMSGIELAQRIKSDARTRDTRLVILTSMGRNSSKEEIERAEILAFLTKPVRKSELHGQILHVMGVSNDGLAPPQVEAQDDQPQRKLERLNAVILLAEDNPVNQEVAREHLMALGCRVDVATTGLEAVVAVGRKAYDLVLMDCQMPEMDGYEATTLIRLREDQTSSDARLPIIAQTGNAFEKDRARCFGAGMDDFLSKPYRREELRAKLVQWIAPRGDVGERASPEESGDEGATSVLDQRALEDIRRIRDSGAPDTVSKIIGLYIEGSQKLLAALEEAIARGDPEALREAAHTLKSSSATVGAQVLASYCQQLEVFGRDETLQLAEPVVKEMHVQLDRACKALETELSSTAA